MYVRVELPTYAHSFSVNVPNDANVLQLKQEISKSCTGGPRVDGQRLIWHGRYLSDHEKLETLWTSAEEARIVHLSVHPSAWSSNPPNHHKEPVSSTPSVQAPTPTRTIPSMSQASQPAPTLPRSSPSPTVDPLAYVLTKHRKALSILMQQPYSQDNSSQSEESRKLATQFVERHGYTWPVIIDESYPSLEAGGLRYEAAVIDDQSYLRLQNPAAKPTAAQLHALNVLSYTLALLKLPPQPPQPVLVNQPQPIELPPHVSALLQQMGLPQPNAALGQPPVPQANRANVVIQAREIHIRPFVLPLAMLLLRILLLLYFVAPARKPVFGILIFAWVMYEIWQPIRNGLARGLQRAVVADQRHQQNAAADAAAAPRAPGDQGADPVQPDGPLQNPQRPAPGAGAELANAAVVLDALANYDVQEEESNLANGAPEPSFGRKAAAFVTLLLATVHPAVWDRRRAQLRRREGRIRTETNAMEAQDEGEDNAQNARRAERRRELLAQHARRPPWIQRYIARVVRGEWVDDSD
ncbi:hypothetical protein K435DRAFT_708706 [Dendrothele bispora CBS 962.96]|uniref:Ubiquitin-like domain-containing protein n=1 Tax=Dendrothele bispora (strain CBS 962.96) TaxID=1314807 RepID=A0A4S8MYZ5_DENBC|nr:hypothetical protein K435DRAFT_708706 [Dendrothele bispora CBS 962.96]